MCDLRGPYGGFAAYLSNRLPLAASPKGLAPG